MQGAPIKTMNRLTVLDNFYNNPKQIISAAEFKHGGCGGVHSERSLPLHELDPSLHRDFTSYICSIFNLDPNTVYVYSHLSRQSFSELNSGLIHVDGRNSLTGEYADFKSYNKLYGGTIFLSDEYDRNCGVALYDDITNKSVEDKFNFAIRSLYDNKNKLSDGRMSKHEYDTLEKEYNSNFEVSSFVSNVYNRMVSWKCGHPHKTILTEKQGILLTQNFYIWTL